jgi:hypothetical protein
MVDDLQQDFQPLVAAQASVKLAVGVLCRGETAEAADGAFHITTVRSARSFSEHFPVKCE